MKKLYKNIFLSLGLLLSAVGIAQATIPSDKVGSHCVTMGNYNLDNSDPATDAPHFLSYLSDDFGLTWSDPHYFDPLSFRLNMYDLSCNAQGDCMAVGGKWERGMYGGLGKPLAYISHDFGQTWDLNLPPAPVDENYHHNLHAVTCTGQTCLALDSRSLLYRTTDFGKTWEVKSISGGGLNALTCNDNGVCITTGYHTVYDAQYGDGTAPIAYLSKDLGLTWEVTKPPRVNIFGGLGAVDCSLGDRCIVSGSNSDYYTDFYTTDILDLATGTWSSYTLPLPDNIDTLSIEGMTCNATGDCVMVGSYDDNGYDTHALSYASSDLGKTWALTLMPLPADLPVNRLEQVANTDVACDSEGVCVAVGNYTYRSSDRSFYSTESYSYTSHDMGKHWDPVVFLKPVTTPGQHFLTGIHCEMWD